MEDDMRTSSGHKDKLIEKEVQQGTLGNTSLLSGTNYIKGQRIHWPGYIMKKRKEGTIKAVMEWKLEGKRPQSTSRKR